ncbi:O-antigen ligase family protein [Pusillimonas noertemannii]|uniref:O-antigen ligase family protein n=1 Tax=Pusillimonas noertemannii TaxID=305977 RepID=UPI00031F42B4|nr:O-antigen ligase family protein [Pusillimonas noertemannii]
MLAISIVALYILLPITLLTSHSLPSGIFYALIATSLFFLKDKGLAITKERTYKYRWLIAGYSALLLVVVISSAYHGEWAGANSEGALRFLLGLWVLLLTLPYISEKYLRSIMWGIYAASLTSTAIVFWLVLNSTHRPSTPAIIIVSYTSLLLLLSVLTIYSLKWQLTRWKRAENILKILLAGAAFGVFLAAQTRTGLLGMPIFILLGLVLFIGTEKPSRLLIGAITLGVLLAVALTNSDAMRTRIVQGLNEVQACQGEKNTQLSSMCIRLQMWRAAIDGGTNHPWTGLGDGGKFNDYMQDAGVPKGLVAQAVVDEPFGEPHNDLLLMFFAFGFPGVLSLLLIYLLPCTYFFPRLLSKKITPQAKAAAAMGLAVCLGFFFFGITETMFRRMNTIGFYTALVAWFMVLSETRCAQQTTPASSTPA